MQVIPQYLDKVTGERVTIISEKDGICTLRETDSDRSTYFYKRSKMSLHTIAPIRLPENGEVVWAKVWENHVTARTFDKRQVLRVYTHDGGLLPCGGSVLHYVSVNVTGRSVLFELGMFPEGGWFNPESFPNQRWE